jgi:transcriptional regulator with GAF, ATPase, and Fis domain
MDAKGKNNDRMRFRGDPKMKVNPIDSFFYALVRVIDLIYQDEEELSDILHFIVSLASELTGAKGSTIRVLEQGTFNLKVLSSYGLSQAYLNSGAIDYGKSVTEIMKGDIIMIKDFENDPRIQNLSAARKEGVNAVIGIPFTVNDTTYSILRVYYASKKIPTHEEMELLYSLGRLSCVAIERAVMSEIRKSA